MKSESKQPIRTYVNGTTYFINGDFNDEMRQAVIWNLEKHIKNLKNKKNAILTFYISSYGGDGYLVQDMISLFEIAKANDIIVRTIVTSHAYSAASMLAIAGTKGERYISEYAEHLAHYGDFDGYRKSTPLQLDRNHEHHKRWVENIIKQYNKYCSIPSLRTKLKDDAFYIPAELCLKWQLADKYFENFEEIND